MSDKGYDIKELDEKPSITGLEWIWQGFWDLSTERQIGMGLGPIPWSSITAYIEWHGYDEIEEMEFRYCISKLDEQFLRHQEKKDGSGSQKSKN